MVISRRTARTEKGNSRSDTDTDGDGNGKLKKWKSASVRLLFAGALLVCILIVYVAAGFGKPQEGNITSKSATASAEQEDASFKTRNARAQAVKKYENCTVSFQPFPARKETDWRKPLWVPSYPGSGSASPSKKGDVVKALIDSFTGLKAATKNYHMSMKNRLRRCHGLSETAACSQGHPYVPIGPDKQTKKFQSPVIFVLRNVALAFPAGHTEKGIAYHNAPGQAKENEWRHVRDKHLQGGVKTWIEMIRWWRTADYYKIGLYVPYEKLLDTETGPPLVQRLAEQFKTAGYDVASAQDIPCIWFKATRVEWRRQDQLMEYVPGYTKEQQNMILDELKNFMVEVEDDKGLTEVLKEYYADVRDHTRLDKLWENQTETR